VGRSVWELGGVSGWRRSENRPRSANVIYGRSQKWMLKKIYSTHFVVSRMKCVSDKTSQKFKTFSCLLL
jgi:hypothetical protein